MRFPKKRSAEPFAEAEAPEANIATGRSYAFSGGYGTGLLDEVNNYAIVAKTIASQYSFDVIHAHDWMTFKAGLEAKKVSNKPLILHVHATEFDRAGLGGNPLVYDIEKNCFTEADHIVAVSGWTKQILISNYGLPPEKVTVVHNGILPQKNKSENFAIPFDYPVVSFLGRITYQKGPLYFVEAARRVLDKFPDTHFVVGGAGDLLPAMIERIAQLRMSTNFHFVGFLKGNQVDKLWSISDVYVMPSVSEPFGITPLEAIRSGVPIIISNQAGVAEVMPHAIKVDFWNSRALADAICCILKYKSLSSTLKKNSSEEIKNISWNKAAKKINHLYHELTTKTQPQPSFIFSGSSTSQAEII